MIYARRSGISVDLKLYSHSKNTLSLFCNIQQSAVIQYRVLEGVNFLLLVTSKRTETGLGIEMRN